MLSCSTTSGGFWDFELETQLNPKEIKEKKGLKMFFEVICFSQLKLSGKRSVFQFKNQLYSLISGEPHGCKIWKANYIEPINRALERVQLGHVGREVIWNDPANGLWLQSGWLRCHSMRRLRNGCSGSRKRVLVLWAKRRKNLCFNQS